MTPAEMKRARRRVALAPKLPPESERRVERVHPALVDLVKERTGQGVQVSAWTLRGGHVR